MKRLPIGIQTFEKLVGEGFAYVDKTRFVADLGGEGGGYYFLSRPRRFGKSLFLSTIKAAFEGKRDLFRGLYLENNWDWEQTNPVIQVSFGAGMVRSVDELRDTLEEILIRNCRHHAIDSLASPSLKGRFLELIELVNAKYSRPVVVLVDEYDKPILDSIHKTDLAVAIREELKNIYSVLKEGDPYIKLVFITGVSKFSKVSLFSGLNNLKDMTIDKRYSSLCGYTQQELEEVFVEYLDGVDLDAVQAWYNGYSWLGEAVYNPLDVLLYLDTGEFLSYWFETGTPSFLVQLLRRGRYAIPDIERFEAGEEIVGSFEIEDISVETLLFQAGYLTLKKAEQIGTFRRYELGYPNLEVKSSLCSSILTDLCRDRVAKTRNQSRLLDAFMENDFGKMEEVFHSFFASIPGEWLRENQTAGYEAYYASVVYCYFAATGIDVCPERHSNKGRLDLTVRFQDRIYVIEFKVVEQSGPGKALEQIRNKGYAEQFVGQEVYLVGVEFSSEEKNIVLFEWERR